MNEKLTEQETIDVLNRRLFQFDSLYKKYQGESNTIFDELPCGVQVNPLEGGVSFINQHSAHFFRMEKEEILSLGPSYISHFIPYREERKKIVSEIQSLYKRNDPSAILGHFQRLIPRGKEKHEWVFISSKLLFMPGEKFAQNRIITVLPIQYMGDFSNKINRVLEENLYFKKYFKQFVDLTKREKEIIGHVAKGYSSKQIADILFISKDTVSQHRKNINQKLDFNSYYEMIKFSEVFELI